MAEVNTGSGHKTAGSGRGNRWAGFLLAAIVGGLLLLCGGAALRGEETSDETTAGRPSVTREESRVLERARETAENDLQEAIAVLEKAEGSESSAALPFTRGTYHQRAGELDEAATAYREALERKRDFHDARLNLARVLMELGEYGEASRQIEMLLSSSYSDKGLPWTLLGRCRLLAGHRVAAEAAYRQAMAYRPDSRAARSGLVKALLEQGELVRARGLLKQQIERHPLQGEMWKLLAQSYIEAGQPKKALRKLEAARRLEVADTDALTTLGRLLLNHDYPAAALDVYREAAALEDAPVGRLLEAARAMIAVGNVEEGRGLLQDLRTREDSMDNEQDAIVTFLRGRIAETKSNMDKALKLYQQVLQKQPLHAEALMRVGDILRERGKLEKASVYYERAGRADTDVKPKALVRRAQMAVSTENYEEAIDLLKKSLELENVDYVQDYLQQVREAAR